MKTIDNIKAYICESFPVGFWSRKTIKVARESVKIFITILKYYSNVIYILKTTTLFANVIIPFFSPPT